MANRFAGSYRRVAEKTRDGGPRGVARMIRILKQDEARARQSMTPHNKTKRHRVMGARCCDYL